MKRADEIRKRLKEIRMEQRRIDNLIAKQEEDGNYNDGFYREIEKLEDERNNLELELEAIENN